MCCRSLHIIRRFSALMWNNFLCKAMRTEWDYIQAVLKVMCFYAFIQHTVAPDPAGVKRIHKDLEQLRLPPSAFSASSVYKNQPESQAHKANLVVFASQEESSGAWCPAKPIQAERSEWLQIEFDTLKIMRVLFTEGRANNQLLYANNNSQTIAISLDPPIVAKRFRLYPYNELEPRFMCLRIAVYGSVFTDGVIEYSIPEGDVYRMDPRQHVSLNDTSYDGSWIIPPVTSNNPESITSRRAYFYGGIGLLMDKQYYEGSLPETADNHNVVGWFRRQHSRPSEHIMMLFCFDQVRNFTELRLHALNSLRYVALFRRALIQFSIGGRYYDRKSAAILYEGRRDTQSRQARWVSIPLDHRIGRFVRITLWFDYDWIVLSEITFDSVPVSSSMVPAVEKLSDPVMKLSDVDLNQLDEQHLPWSNFDYSVEERDEQQNGSTGRTALDSLVPPTGSLAPKISLDPPLLVQTQPARHRNIVDDSPVNSVAKGRSSNIPYIIAILCCCLGSVAFATLFGFMLYRLRRHRHRRLKKSHKNQLQSIDGTKHQLPLLLGSSHHTPNNFYPPGTSTSTLIADPSLQSMLANSLQYKNAPSGTVKPDSTMFGIPYNTAGLFSPGSVSLSHPLPDTITSQHYTAFAPGLDQESLLALQLLHSGSTPGSNFSSLGGAMTMSRRGIHEPYPLVSVSTACPYPPTVAITNSHVPAMNNGPVKLPFCPPPPPDQPLPPLPPPSTSPDLIQRQPFPDNPSGNRIQGSSGPSVASYAPPFPTHSFAPDSGLMLSLDGSMPEYASASLFSGNGSVQPSPGQPPLAGPASAKPLGPDCDKTKGSGETYCVPHQNGIHGHGSLWGPSQSQFPPRLDLLTTGTNITFSTVPGTNSDCHTGSLGSSGMYYLTNTTDSAQFDLNQIPVHDPSLHPSAMFLPFPSSTHFVPMHGLTLFPEQRVDVPGGVLKFPQNLFDTQRATADSEFSRFAASLNHSASGTNGTTDTTDGQGDSG
ncbi:DNA damage responsive protein [Clonorchis sinensis]|uniref:DNA damage responsive protein n=1 Tax=Clonorchis sinensis TaxID=79923 RepID=A0A8T1MME9_CLOSI|nr:DNA damage responsive protein [Clonorchis sinensis]